MAQTFSAITHGLATFRSDLSFAGVIPNHVASLSHYQMLIESLPPHIKSFGWLARDEKSSLPSRHLGLLQGNEINDIETRINRAADALNDLITTLPDSVTFSAKKLTPHPLYLKGLCIAVAFDPAFSFLYRANIDLLRDLGADIRFFSPLTDTSLPKADTLYLPGGYPELYLERLAGNQPIKKKPFSCTIKLINPSLQSVVGCYTYANLSQIPTLTASR